MLNRQVLRRFFREGWWRRPLFAYRLWRTETRRWGSAKEVWEYIGRDQAVAYLMMNNSKNEEELRSSGQRVAQALRQGLDIRPDHRVLEVGCGVARIGRELAPYCGEWWGCDISGSVIQIAERRTAQLGNVHFRVLEESSLRGFEENAFDRVYCHAVFMHLAQIDVFAYVEEMCRVVKPGGLVFYDGINLTTEEGWSRFIWEVEHYRGREVRPIHLSRFTTPEEMRVYAQRAGLGLLYCLTPRFWVQVVAAKYRDGDLSDKEREKFLERLRGRVDYEALAAI